LGTRPPDRDDPYEDIDPEDLAEEPGLEEREMDDDAFRTPDGAYSDEPYDPAMQPVIDAGGGVAEGFEQSEAELVDHASHGDDQGTERILRDAFDEEAEEDRGVYGDADEEDVSEDET
jgi:hypothetical protein